MQEIKEEDDETLKHHSISQTSEAFRRTKQLHSNENTHNPYSQPDQEAAFVKNDPKNPAESYMRRAPNTAGGYRPRKNKSKAMNHEELLGEISELKKSNRKDLEEIKKLKAEQTKIETLYRKYKEQENDVFTAERLIAKTDIKQGN
jgi:hypothetical protein